MLMFRCPERSRSMVDMLPFEAPDAVHLFYTNFHVRANWRNDYLPWNDLKPEWLRPSA
jgi:hypothetical protein